MVDITSGNGNSNQKFMCGVVEGFYGRPWSPEQRRDLFLKMKKWELNTYMYAPKDDFKHRAYWRDLYTVEEAEHLTSLIQAAKESGILFCYALSPGLDITYSSAKEVMCLKRKLEQVSQFGCNSFALLFDDIETEISETDKEVFQSFAHAQVSVTNEVYQHLSSPTFIFCPTEYCAARAVPNVQTSDYLATIGSKLLPGIDIMWTGARVISKVITVESIQELTEVLHRPPVIWDNIHANDYDQKRLFLGPYSGRSTELIPRLHGVLTNPNCEYEMNFIPIHTIAQWSKCNSDGKLEINDSISADIKLESENETGSLEEIPSHLDPNIYHPKKALKLAISDWLPEFESSKNAFGHVLAAPFVQAAISGCPTPLINPCTTIPNRLADNDLDLQPLSTELVNSLVATESTIPKEDIVPMDCNSEPLDIPMPDSSETMQTEVERLNIEVIPVDDLKQLAYEDISILVDLFYLPFEHGRQGVLIAQEFQWLKAHGHIVSSLRGKKDTENLEVQEWYNRASKFDQLTRNTGKLLLKLNYCQNRSLLYDLYSYVWDIKGVISLLNSYIKWIALGRFPIDVSSLICPAFSWFSKGYKEAFMSGEQEPWLFRGGLTAELQRLLPLESVSDLFLYKSPDSPSTKIYTIRPYLNADEKAVYHVCRKTCDDGSDGSEVFPELPDLIGDKLVGGYLWLSSEYCFVVEDESGVCGYALAALDARQFYPKLDNVWIPELCSKYPPPMKDPNEMLSPAEEIITSFHCSKKAYVPYPDEVYKNHSSIIRMSLLNSISDLSVPKRLLTCILSTLKANGSNGVFAEIPVGDKNVIEFYSKLGFTEITLSNSIEDVFYYGRTF